VTILPRKTGQIRFEQVTPFTFVHVQQRFRSSVKYMGTGVQQNSRELRFSSKNKHAAHGFQTGVLLYLIAFQSMFIAISSFCPHSILMYFCCSCWASSPALLPSLLTFTFLALFAVALQLP
jgi:hypothetical protein